MVWMLPKLRFYRSFYNVFFSRVVTSIVAKEIFITRVIRFRCKINAPLTSYVLNFCTFEPQRWSSSKSKLRRPRHPAQPCSPRSTLPIGYPSPQVVINLIATTLSERPKTPYLRR